MKIYDTLGIEKFDVTIDGKTKLKQSLKGLNRVSCVFSTSEYLDIVIGDYIDISEFVPSKGGKFILTNEPSVKKARTNQYDYNIDFLSEKSQFVKALVVLDDKTEHHVFGTLQDQLNHVLTNVNRVLDDTYTLSIPVWTETLNISYENVNCLDALDDLVTTFEKEYYFDGNVLSVVDKVGTATNLTVQFKNGLKGITRKKLRENELVTRLYPLGGERNITSKYGFKRLRIPSIDKNVDLFGIYEKTKIFEDIYPHRTGTVTSIGGDFFKFIDDGMSFDLNQDGILIPGHLAKITFNSGDLQGYEFEIISYNDQTNEFYLKEYDDGNGLVVPSETLKPRVTDSYVIYGMNMPDEYILTAEQELRKKADEFLEFASFPTVVYEVTPDVSYMRDKGITLNIGDEIKIFDIEMDFDILTRITELTQSLVDEHEYTLKVGNKVKEGFVREISKKTSSIESKLSSEVATISKTINHLAGKSSGETTQNENLPVSVGNSLLKPEAKGLNYIISKLKISPNYSDNANRVYFEACDFSHFTIESSPRVWDIPSRLSEIQEDSSRYYIYLMCSKNDDNGVFLVSKDFYLTESGSEQYYFLIGVLSAIGDDGSRVLNAFSVGGGTTSINNVTQVTQITGGTDDGATIKQKYEAENNTNALTDALLSKLNSIDPSGNITDIMFGDFQVFKAQGNNIPGELSKNDVIEIRLTNDTIYRLLYDGVGDPTSISSYRILNRTKITQLFI